MSARVFGISIDPVDRNRAMVEKLILPFSLLADTDGTVIKQYGVWHEERQMARPAIFVIDGEGVVRYAYTGEDYADRPVDDEVHAVLKELGDDR